MRAYPDDREQLLNTNSGHVVVAKCRHASGQDGVWSLGDNVRNVVPRAYPPFPDLSFTVDDLTIADGLAVVKAYVSALAGGRGSCTGTGTSFRQGSIAERDPATVSRSPPKRALPQTGSLGS
jgi:hypothetical protein